MIDIWYRMNVKENWALNKPKSFLFYSSHNKCSTSTAVTPNSATTGNSFRKDPTSKTALLLPLIVLVSLTALLTMLWLLLSMIFCWSKLQEVAIRKRAVVIARARGSDRPDFGSSGKMSKYWSVILNVTTFTYSFPFRFLRLSDRGHFLIWIVTLILFAMDVHERVNQYVIF